MICKDRAVLCLTVQGTALRGPLTASCAFRANTFAAQHKWAQTFFPWTSDALSFTGGI